VDRRELVEKVKAILQSQQRKAEEKVGKPVDGGDFYLIIGETGVGKSTVLLEALSEVAKHGKPPGFAVYMPETITTDAASGLARAIGYDQNRLGRKGGATRQTSFTTKEESSKVDWDKLEECLLSAAVAFNAKYGRPPVVVIDAADYIAKGEDKFFTRLLAFAKSQADKGGFASSSAPARVPQFPCSWMTRPRSALM